MSTPDSASRAAELAAKQVEAIVEAAQTAADGIEAEAERKLAAQRAQLEAEFASRQQALEEEVGKIRQEALQQADRERQEAHEQATRERDEAIAEVKRIREEARRDATTRVAAAEQAADEALADARAISAGLRRLGQSLEEYAERILRDVQTGHRRLRSDLRVASGGPASPGESARRSASSSEPAARPSRRSNPFDEIDIPGWVAPDE